MTAIPAILTADTGDAPDRDLSLSSFFYRGNHVKHFLLPVIKDLAVSDGYVHAGAPGAGHFIKLVHNGIEFGMLQAIGEGMDLLEHYRDKLNIAEVLKCWRHGSVIRSWLIDLMEAAYRSEGGLSKIPSYVDDTGEVNWLVNDALRMEVPVPVIDQAVMQLFSSRDDQKNWAKAIAMMRHGFGGHAYGPSKPASDERKKVAWEIFLRNKSPLPNPPQPSFSKGGLRPHTNGLVWGERWINGKREGSG